MKIVELPETIRRYGKVAAKGLIAEMAPGMFKGVLIETLEEKKVTAKMIAEAVDKNESLWAVLGNSRNTLGNLIKATKVRPTWLSSRWIIDSLKGDMPEIARLLREWPKARRWLDRQIEDIKNQLEKEP